MNRQLPSFLIIGAAKSGTTALSRYLEQHPQVFLTEPKEPHFFALEGPRPQFQGPGDDQWMNRLAVTNLEEYKRLYENSDGKVARGEGSVSTMYYPESIARIKKYVEDPRLIAILRHPAERAWSAFSFMHSLSLEPCQDFRKSLDLESDRIAAHWHHIWHYQRQGMYFEQLKPFYEAFAPNQIKVFLYEDFRDSPRKVLFDCFNFIGVEPAFQPLEEPSTLVSGIPKSRMLQRLVTHSQRIRKVLKNIVPPKTRRLINQKFDSLNLRKEKINTEVYNELSARFREDIIQLQSLIQRDLSNWLKPIER